MTTAAWVPEDTPEYTAFKKVSQEDAFLERFLSQKYSLAPGELLLDIGARDGSICLRLQSPEYIHIAEPDPTVQLPFSPQKFWRQKIQDVQLEDTYKLIVCSHVMGYLRRQGVQPQVFQQLIDALALGGTLVLFYNTNSGFVGELLELSKKIIPNGHYDYFDESLLLTLPDEAFNIGVKDEQFELSYKTFEELSRSCWFLFGGYENDIAGVSEKFLPILMASLTNPRVMLDQRIVCITKLR